VFLDRDGIINKALVIGGKPYPPSCVEAVQLEEGIEELLNYLKEKYLIIVISNQPDVARGIQTREEVEKINSYLKSKLPIDDFFVCYHDDKDNCNCRKPKPGLLLEAIRKYDIDIYDCWIIGDRKSDIDISTKPYNIFVDYNYDEKKPSAVDYTVKSVSEIINVFKEKDIEDQYLCRRS
jgi:D-glycero-D-manno-heptose 1,7-bisphosphate phosphatase